jgi:hypothetical protein
MEIIESIDNLQFSVKNKDNSVNSEFVFFFARPGYGKTLACESLIELYHKAGYTILCLSDVKDEWELGYAMFEPEKPYHLNRLRKDGIKPNKKDVILYHPFTFNIPEKLLPDINFYGFGLKELKRSEFSMISESAWESDTTRILLNASSNIPDNMGLYGFVHYIQDTIVGKKQGKDIKPDPKLFNLRVTGGTAKSLQDIASYFLPFEKNYFLVPNNSFLKLDWEKILNDNKHYHVFGSCYLEDAKLKEFCILTLLNSIIRNRKKGNKPVLIYIPEIRFLVPYRPEGYKKFLAFSIKSNLSIMRNMGKGGIAGVFDSQSLTDTDEDVRKSATKTFLGEMADKDVEHISKSLRWSKEQIKPLIQSDAERTSQPSFIFAGNIDVGSWTPRFPSHCHAEESYDFNEMYREKYRDKMKSYNELTSKVKKQFQEEKEKILEKIKREEQKVKEEKEKKKIKETDKKEQQDKKPVKKLSETEKERIERDMQIAYNMSIDENLPKKERSVRGISIKLLKSPSTIAEYIKKYKTRLQNQEYSLDSSE